MRKQQEDIEAKRFLSEKDLNDNNLASRTRRRNNVRDKNERHVRKYEKKETQDALERLRENTSRFKDKQDIVIY